MHLAPEKPKTRKFTLATLIALVLIYGIGHLPSPFLQISASPLFTLSGPSIAYAQEDEEDEEDEDNIQHRRQIDTRLIGLFRLSATH